MPIFSRGLVLLVNCVLGCSLAAQTTTDTSNKTDTSNNTHRTQVAVLGTFHFNQVEPRNEMLNEKRQAEIVEVLDQLEAFKPDKIFVERNPEFEYTNKLGERYQEYLRGELKLPANEIYQLGFRLGKRLGHTEIFQADHPGLYGSYNSKVTDYAKKHDQMDVLEGKAPATTLGLDKTKHTDEFRKNQTLSEYLTFLNSKEYELADHGWYLSTLPRIGDTNAPLTENEEKDFENEYFIGSMMLADWYRRNIMIYSKVLNQMDYSEERVLVIFGAGHNSTLKHLFESNPHFEVVDSAKLLSTKKK